ncbi:MAG: hypothetical protein J1F67_04985 [Muribaculaceae bacterium]|nr:hypothetical protein [Muribaculaceae bacterium]
MGSGLNKFVKNFPSPKEVMEDYVDRMIDEKLFGMLLEIKKEIKDDVMAKLDKGNLW